MQNKKLHSWLEEGNAHAPPESSLYKSAVKSFSPSKASLHVSVGLSLGCDFSVGLGWNWTLSDSLRSLGLTLSSIPFSVSYHTLPYTP